MSGFLFFAFFEDNMLAGFWIVLFKFNLTSDELLVLARPVHLSGAFVFKLYELILGHDLNGLVSRWFQGLPKT